ncbi:C-terminal binding protein [Acetomicrobium mobile]|uniref:C-terminal binding protein n=1 Tax=Acetomicrobium mobile TaxID=97477 RepID=UPI0026F2E01F|nr:C-terminal binding protein [Acetomicrobium mobile]
MKVIITDCDHDSIKIEEDILNAAGLEFKLLQCRTEDDVIQKCGEAEIFINQYAPITERVIRELPNLKIVIRYGVGVDNVDLDAATKYGVIVCNVPDYGMNEVAEQAMALMFALVRKTVIMVNDTKAGNWDYTKAVPIHRFNCLTIGICGMGRIGRNFAHKVRPLTSNIICYDPFVHPCEANGLEFVKSVDFDTLLRESDIISIHTPLNKDTKGMFDMNAFRKMKKSAYLINTARGGIVNEKDLDEALAIGEIGGAALDCMENEPVIGGHPLYKHDNFLPTPHMSWYSEEAYRELKRKVAEEAVRFSKGEKLRDPVNAPRAPR